MAKAAVAAAPPGKPRPSEPVWLVRVVLLLFLVGFAAFLARETRSLLDALGLTRSELYWTGLGVGLAAGALLGLAGGFAWGKWRRRR